MKKLKLIAAALAAVMSASTVCISAFAETTQISGREFTIENLTVDSTVIGGTRMPNFSLADDEDSVVIELTDVSNPYEEYRISLYTYENGEGTGYAIKQLGPIRTSSFRLTGLEGGKEYYLLISATTNKQKISGRFYTAKGGGDSQ